MLGNSRSPTIGPWILRSVFSLSATKLLWIGASRGPVPLEKSKPANLKSMVISWSFHGDLMGFNGIYMEFSWDLLGYMMVYPPVMTNIAMEFRWPIYIDGLPN